MVHKLVSLWNFIKIFIIILKHKNTYYYIVENSQNETENSYLKKIKKL